MMKIQIHGAGRAIPGSSRDEGELDALRVSRSPDGRYAVAEILGGECFVAFRVERDEDERLTGRFVDLYMDQDVVPMLKRYRVEWRYIDQGFAKLILFAPEMSERFKGCFEGTVRRFWFDRALYERRYLEKYGVPPHHAGEPREEEKDG